jgi:hypothetical protein
VAGFYCEVKRHLRQKLVSSRQERRAAAKLLTSDETPSIAKLPEILRGRADIESNAQGVVNKPM